MIAAEHNANWRPFWEQYIPVAGEIIKALRNPTDNMAEAIIYEDERTDTDEPKFIRIWRAGIDKARGKK